MSSCLELRPIWTFWNLGILKIVIGKYFEVANNQNILANSKYSEKHRKFFCDKRTLWMLYSIKIYSKGYFNLKLCVYFALAKVYHL